MNFNIGDKVFHLPSKEEGYIIKAETFGRKKKMIYEVVINGKVYPTTEMDLKPTCNTSDPFERCENGLYGTRIEYVKTNTTYKIKNSNDTSISSLKASTTLFKQHQFKPLLKFINSDNRRILIADEVGLGKTIEAGHIMLELKARKELENVLIVCPMSLREKWKNEMKSKFGLYFEIIDEVSYLISLLRSHNRHVRAIINYEKIRYIEEEGKKDTNKNLLNYLEGAKDRKFSLVVCDEAHKMRNVNQTSAGGRELLKYADAAVFLTATPLMTKSEDLYNLLRLLDENIYDEYQMFRNHLNENKPFVTALSQIDGGVPLNIVADNLENSNITTEYFVNDILISHEEKLVKDYFINYPLYQRAIKNLRSGIETRENKAMIRYDLSSMSMMNNIISRTRKREVTTDLSQAERNPIKKLAVLEDYEQSRYDGILQEYWDEHCTTNFYGEEVLRKDAILPYVNLRQRLSSSVFGFLNKREDLERGYDKFSKFEDGKFNELLDVIDEVFVNGKRKVIVFVNYINTLLYLQIRLRKAGFESVLLYGAVKDRDTEIEKFRTDASIPVLLANEVASEGIDLQFCDTLVNYDLPWNPMVVEQRIGRIDRLGQESEYIHIYNLIVADSIQEDICLRLLDRIGLFRNAIGDMETILDAEIEQEGKHVTIMDLYNQLEKDVYCSHWSPEVLKKKEEEVLMAIENERTSIKKMEEGFANSLTNDAYFEQEINRILNNNAYVTEFELKNFLDMLFREKLTLCTLENVKDGVYDIVQPKSDVKVLKNFLVSNMPASQENEQAFESFIKNKIREKQRIRITFNQELAFRDKNLIYINIYNPLILAASHYFLDKNGEDNKTFCFSLHADNYIHQGDVFFLAICKLETKQNIFGVEKVSNTLIPILFNVNKEAIEDQNLSNHVWAMSQSSDMLRSQSVVPQVDNFVIKEMKVAIVDERDRIIKERMDEINLQHDNRKMIKLEEYKKWYESRIKNYRRNISNHEGLLSGAIMSNDESAIKKEQGVIRRMEGALAKTQREHQKKLENFEVPANVRVNPEFVTISLINVI